MNHKAHFKGDIQVDGFILDADGNPIAGGGPDFVGADGLDFGEGVTVGREADVGNDKPILAVRTLGLELIDDVENPTTQSDIFGQSFWAHTRDWNKGIGMGFHQVGRPFTTAYDAEGGSNLWSDKLEFAAVGLNPDIRLERIGVGKLNLGVRVLPDFANLDWQKGLTVDGALRLSNDGDGYVAIGMDTDDHFWDITVDNSDGSINFHHKADGTGGGGTFPLAMSPTRAYANELEISANGAGLVAHSPDGTAYKLVPPNGGGAATWVAA